MISELYVNKKLIKTFKPFIYSLAYSRNLIKAHNTQ